MRRECVFFRFPYSSVFVAFLVLCFFNVVRYFTNIFLGGVGKGARFFASHNGVFSVFTR